MPRVPTYDNFNALPSVQPQTAVRAPNAPDVAGEQLRQAGQAMMGTGGQLSRIAFDAAQQANQVRVNDAMNRAVQARLRLTYDPNEGFSHLKGDSALTRPDGKSLDAEYGDRLKQELDAIEQGLGNEAQRAAFRQQAGQMAVQFQGSLTQHVAQEFGRYRVSVQDGTIATARDQMALAWGDTDAVAQSINAIKAAVAEKGRITGLSGKAIEAATVDALSPGHASVVMSAIDAGKLEFAREYAKQYDAEFTPEARLQLRKTLEAGDFETRTQNKADELWTKHGGDAAAALKEVRASMSGKDEDAVVQRIKALDAEKTTLRERAQRDAADAAWRYVAEGRMPPPSIMSQLDGRDVVSIRKTLSEPPPQRTNMSKWLEFTNMPPEQMAALSPTDLMRDYREHFSDSDLRNANNMILAARGMRGKGPKNDDGLQLISTADLMKRTAREIGILPKSGDKLTPEQDAAFMDFTAAMQIKVNTWEAANGKKASPEVLSKLLNEEKVNKVRLNVFGSDPEMPIIAVPADRLDRAYVVVGQREIKLAQIPAQYRADAIRRIQSRGLAPTEQLIASMWAADNPEKK